MTEQPEVVDLVDAGVPADQGLSSLGMIMQLAGNLFAATMSLLLFVILIQSSQMHGSGNGEMLWMLLLLGLSIARSLVHRSAGAQLLYGVAGSGQGSRIAGIRRYILFALGHSALFGAVIAFKFEAPGKVALAIAAGLALWPAVLLGILALPRFKRFNEDLPLTEDKGFEGASILMTVLGLCGLVGGATLLFYMLSLPGSVLTKGPGVLIVLSLAMLVVRSFLHVQAGLSGLRETSVDRSVELANRYANFGVISSFCAGGALMLFIMSISFELTSLTVVCGLVWMLMAWPLIIRRFFSDRQFADLLAGSQAPVHRRSPDAGLTWLGWLLIALAVYQASFLLMQFSMDPREMRHNPMGELLAMGGAAGLRSMWWSVGLVLLQAWAGYELVRMSPQSKIIATIFGAVAVAVTVYLYWPILDAVRHAGSGHGKMGMSDTLVFGPLVIQLILPVSTILLVNRKISPQARARFRSRTPDAPPPAAPVG
ncbi:MAG: hypothetical protein ACM31C_33035 [Acidobacteriota bacterium]